MPDGRNNFDLCSQLDNVTYQIVHLFLFSFFLFARERYLGLLAF